ncbi:MarR family transcriptional regulator [Sodalis sp. dw_96]|uniref:MarR family winged helix-turn-helix transcriptional regulator n=1 Tax=Sodalis sp. dw_96 TaxID=2719794 RepID=UPI001BD6A3E0|nr:MarR family transcriptional regulator [Sodalis sp. dw_96]
MKVEHQAFHLMRRIFQQHTSNWQQLLPDLTKPQYAVLCAIAEHPGIEQVQLMAAAVSTKATLAELLARLEKRGLLRRVRDAADKRRRFIWLTDEGQAMLDVSQPLAFDADQAFLKRLSALDQQVLLRLLLQMADNKETG